jgi:YD repeat-containing protein
MKKDFNGLLFSFCCFSILAALPVGAAFSQESNAEENPSYTKTIPPAPTAASLGKYGDVPVSYYTGIPNINVPLYEARSGDISVPVSLSYHAGGIKVEEIASWVGLGWSLNAGGVITRTVRGIADEKDQMQRTYKENIDLYNAASSQTAKNEILKKIVDGELDAEPDLFHFNFGGNSGKFFIGEDGSTVYTIPQQKLEISFTKTAGGGNSAHITSWTIVDQSGFTYTFGKSPANATLNGVEYNDTYSACADGQSTSTSVSLATSWFLVEIKSPRGHIITFEYDSYTYNFRNLGNQTEYYCNIQDQNGQNPKCIDRTVFCFTRNTVTGKKLRKINFLNGSVEFETKDRFDLCGEKALEFVKVFRLGETNPVKTLTFDYSYFVGIGKWQQPTSCVSEQEDAFYRLKLNSVKETGANNEEKNPYQFYYDDEINQMPPRYRDLSTTSADSYAQDHWGYYNGKLNNKDSGIPTLIPTVFLENGGSNVIEYGGADRSSVEAFAKTYVLTKIKYPTGGETSFEFESNRIPYEGTFATNELLVPVEKNFFVPAVTSTNLEPGKTVYSQPFTVASDIELSQGYGAIVQIDLWDGGNDYNEETSSSEDCTTTDLVMEREILREDGSLAFSNQSLADGATFFLPNGTYRVKLVRKSATNCNYSNFSVKLDWTQYQKETPEVEPDHILVGGLRVKKIVDYDGIDHSRDKIRTFHYGLFENQSKSSGALISYPTYGWGYYEEEYWQDANPAPNSYNYNCHFLIRQSYTNMPLATTQGAFVSYKNVEVRYGANADNGKNRYTFTNASDYPDGLNFITFPFPPPASQELRRGLMLKEETFGNQDGRFLPVAKRKQQHDLFAGSTSNLTLEVDGLKVGVNFKTFAPSPAELQRNPFVVAIYQTKTDWIPLEWEESTSFRPVVGTEGITQRKEFEYNLNNLQVSKSIVHGSDGEKQITYYKYPLDYSNIPASPTGSLLGIKKLQDQHIISPVIEKYVTKLKGGIEQVVAGQLSSYTESAVNSSLVVPESIYSLQIPSEAVLLSGGGNPFLPSQVSGGSFSIDNRYVEKVKLEHDDEGNLLQWKKTDDIATSYIWGYNNGLPVAEVVNAEYDEIFYTSFEETGSNDANAKTGSKSYSGDYTFNPPPGFSPPADGVLSYFYWDGANWVFHEQPYAGGAVTLSLGTKIDEVRIHPKEAQMTTFTYDLLYGRTSATDQNHITTYFRYDNLGRLQRIQDDKSNVVQKVEYHYTSSTN